MLRELGRSLPVRRDHQPLYSVRQPVAGRREFVTSQDPSCQCHCQECLDLHFSPPVRPDQDPVRQGIVPMETPFIMDNVMDDGMAACSLM